jgi:DNA-binding transcriptional MerR regulator
MPRNRQPAAGQDENDLMRAREAAQLLGASVETLRMWEAEFGYPAGRAAANRQRLYARDQVHALRHALARAQSIPAAIRSARAVAPERSHADGCEHRTSDAHS